MDVCGPLQPAVGIRPGIAVRPAGARRPISRPRPGPSLDRDGRARRRLRAVRPLRRRVPDERRDGHRPDRRGPRPGHTGPGRRPTDRKAGAPRLVGRGHSGRGLRPRRPLRMDRLGSVPNRNVLHRTERTAERLLRISDDGRRLFRDVAATGLAGPGQPMDASGRDVAGLARAGVDLFARGDAGRCRDDAGSRTFPIPHDGRRERGGVRHHRRGPLRGERRRRAFARHASGFLRVGPPVFGAIRTGRNRASLSPVRRRPNAGDGDQQRPGPVEPGRSRRSGPDVPLVSRSDPAPPRRVSDRHPSSARCRSGRRDHARRRVPHAGCPWRVLPHLGPQNRRRLVQPSCGAADVR